MALTYADARAAALAYVTERWGDGEGTPYAGADGLEDMSAYLVPYGAKEYLVDGDLGYRITNNVVLLVDKDTGEVRPRIASEVLARIDAMREVAA